MGGGFYFLVEIKIPLFTYLNLYKTLLLWLAHEIHVYKNPTSIIINEFEVRPCSVYSMVDESSDEPKLFPTRKKICHSSIFSFFPPTF